MKKVLLVSLTMLISASLLAQLKVELDSILKATCPGVNNGAIMITVSGGTAPYEFKWSRPPLEFYTEDIFNIPAGQWSLDVIDYEGVSLNWDTIVLYGEAISISLDISTFGEYQVSCNGCSDGQIQVTYGTGNGNYWDWDYKWTDPNGFTSDGLLVNGLQAGVYQLEIRDTANCGYSHEIVLTQPEAPVYSDTVTVWDTIPITVYDTIPVYDTVYRFTEVKEEVTLTDPLSEETLTVYNYGDYLLTSREFTYALVYNILGSEIKQITLSDQIPVSDLENGIYLFVFKMDTGKAFRKKIFIE